MGVAVLGEYPRAGEARARTPAGGARCIVEVKGSTWTCSWPARARTHHCHSNQVSLHTTCLEFPETAGKVSSLATYLHFKTSVKHLGVCNSACSSAVMHLPNVGIPISPLSVSQLARVLCPSYRHLGCILVAHASVLHCVTLIFVGVPSPKFVCLPERDSQIFVVVHPFHAGNSSGCDS